MVAEGAGGSVVVGDCDLTYLEPETGVTEGRDQAAARELFEETSLRIDAGEIEHFRTVSSDRGDGVLLVFGVAKPRPAEFAGGFTPTAETSEAVVIRAATELAFPLHTDAVAAYFATGG